MKKNKYSTASELRGKARKALRDRWVIATVAFLLIGIFGMMGGGISFDFNFSEDAEILEADNVEISEIEDVDTFEILDDEGTASVIGYLMGIIVLAIVVALIVTLLSLISMLIENLA